MSLIVRVEGNGLPRQASEPLSRQEEASLPPRCDCPKKELRRRRLSNGVLVVASQCIRCGRSHGNVSKKGRDLSALPAWDDSLGERWWNEYRQHWQSQREAKNHSWWEKYESHMRSEKWQDLRRRVLKRAGGICEGCGERKAVQVHHLTYERLGDEMLFDLVAVCLACHEKIHGHPIGDDL